MGSRRPGNFFGKKCFSQQKSKFGNFCRLRNFYHFVHDLDENWWKKGCERALRVHQKNFKDLRRHTWHSQTSTEPGESNARRIMCVRHAQQNLHTFFWEGVKNEDLCLLLSIWHLLAQMKGWGGEGPRCVWWQISREMKGFKLLRPLPYAILNA